MKKIAATLLLMGAVAPGLAYAQAPTPARPTAPMLGEGHARSAMTVFGCNGITALGVAPDGSWHGQCQKGGSTINVMMDQKGTVSQVTGRPPMMTEGQARYALTDFGCGSTSISSLGAGPNGTWHGQCTKGGALINVMVDAQGKASVATGVTHITEGMARSSLTSFGCSNISALSMGGDGTWYGQCYKGGAPINVGVNAQGQSMAR